MTNDKVQNPNGNKEVSWTFNHLDFSGHWDFEIWVCSGSGLAPDLLFVIVSKAWQSTCTAEIASAD